MKSAATRARLKRLRYYRVAGSKPNPAMISGLRRTIAKNAIELAKTTGAEDRALIEDDTSEAQKLLDRLVRRKLAVERAKAHR